MGHDDDHDNFAPDLGLACREAGHAKATFTFTRLEVDTIDRVGHGRYSITCMFPNDDGFAVTIDLDEKRLAYLLKFLQFEEQARIQSILSVPYEMPLMLQLPPGGIVLGVRATLGELVHGPYEDYIPFVAIEFLAPAATSLMAMEG